MKDQAIQRAIEFNDKQTADGAFTGRHKYDLIKAWQAAHGLEPDGWFGPTTAAALDAATNPVSARTPPTRWKFWDGPEEQQPRSRKEIYSMFGSPGHGQADKDWVRRSIVSLHHSRGNALPGQPTNRWVEVHERVEPYLREALRRATLVCPDYPIERIAGFVFRHTRHDPNRPLSVHSWGLAVDINPHWNGAKTFPKNAVPAKFSEKWQKEWPNGLPKAFVEAFASCGWAWGSDWDEDGDNQDHTYQDPMHFEWVERGGGDGKNV